MCSRYIIGVAPYELYLFVQKRVGVAASPAGEFSLQCTGSQQSEQPRTGSHVGQFPGLDNGWRRCRLDRGLPMQTEKIDSLSEDAIHRPVNGFYAKIRIDPELGPVFARAIPGDWGPHLATMRNFWSSVMLTTGRYKGNPVAVHHRVDGIELELFDRWLALFKQTCGELFEDTLANAFHEKAIRIAESLKLALFYWPDRPWPRRTA